MSATQTSSSTPPIDWTFGSAILQIQDHQEICQSAKIRELVLQAIKGGTVIAFTASGTLGSAGGTANAASGTSGTGAKATKTPPTTFNPSTHVTVAASGT